MISFTEKKLHMVLASMKVDTTPDHRQPYILAISNAFSLGRVDAARINFGVLTLIPKVPCADGIRKFRRIALMKAKFKLISKAYAIRFSSIVHCTICRTQSAFIKGGTFTGVSCLCN
jgi:hypothetical protein